MTDQLKRILFNIPGWRTSRKIVVIESDDWGSIRMPSAEVYESNLRAGYRVDAIAYERYDSLLSQDDLELLFDLLSQHKDANENSPVITANCVVANPNFHKIKEDHFRQYHYELITETFKRYPKHEHNFQLWLEGREQGVFFPQYHVREHLNVSKFMRDLQAGDATAHWGFEHGMPGSMALDDSKKGNLYVEALAYDSDEDKRAKLSLYVDGLDLFEKLFGYRSESITPPNYLWSPEFNPSILEKGVRFMQGNRTMFEPTVGGRKRRHRRYLGQRNPLGLTHLVRNAAFEPTLTSATFGNPVDRCLRDMDLAFRMHKPAVISSHRVNYAGFIDTRNRDTTLAYLDDLLKRSLRRWPNIEFLTSCELGEAITSLGGCSS